MVSEIKEKITTLKNYVNGEWKISSSNDKEAVINPARLWMPFTT